MGLREEFKPYFDRAGLVSGQLYPQAPEGNCILKTAHYAMLLKEHGLWGEQDKNELATNIVRECEVRPGLYRRATNWAQDQEARDDYFALAYFSTLLDIPFARYILRFGRQHRFYGVLPYCYDNVKWDRLSPKFVAEPNGSFVSTSYHAWLGRHLELIATLKWATGEEKPSFLEREVFAWGLAYAGSPTDQDGWLLGILQAAVVLPYAEKLERWALDKFFARLNAQGGINLVYTAYLGDEKHPLSRWWV